MLPLGIEPERMTPFELLPRLVKTLRQVQLERLEAPE